MIHNALQIIYIGIFYQVIGKTIITLFYLKIYMYTSVPDANRIQFNALRTIVFNALKIALNAVQNTAFKGFKLQHLMH